MKEYTATQAAKEMKIKMKELNIVMNRHRTRMEESINSLWSVFHDILCREAGWCKSCSGVGFLGCFSCNGTGIDRDILRQTF